MDGVTESSTDAEAGKPEHIEQSYTSLCCSNELQSYQPIDAAILKSLARGGRNFLATCYTLSLVDCVHHKMQSLFFYTVSIA